MEWFKKDQLPPKVKELIVSKVGNYQAEKLIATLLDGTLAQKADIIKDLNLEDYLRVCYNCGKLITKGYMEEGCIASYCSMSCIIKDLGKPYFDSHFFNEENPKGTIFWTSWEHKEGLELTNDDFVSKI